MEVEKAMIFVSIAILICVLGITGLMSGEFGLPDMSSDFKIPDITSSTNTGGVYDYCTKMGLDC